MRNKGNSPRSTRKAARSAGGKRRRISADLESRGLDPALSLPVAERLADIAPDLSADEYDAVLDGLALAYGAGEPQRRPSAPGSDEAREVEEIERLMKGFAGELRKLEEGLRILTAYLRRMRDQTRPGRRSPLH